MKKILISIVAFTSLTLFSFKGEKAVSYQVDAKSSSLVWTGQKVTGEHKGNIDIASGILLVSANKLVGGTFELNVASLTVTDITDKEKNASLVEHLKNEDFFSTAKFPKATFAITKVESKGGDNYDISGNLTIKGITKPSTFPAVVKNTGKNLNATGKVTVNRTLYDINYRSTNFFADLGNKAISDEFTLDVNLVAKAK